MEARNSIPPFSNTARAEAAQGVSFHHHDRGRNSGLGLKPRTLTIQEPLDSGQGQCYQLGLLIENVLLLWRRPIFPPLAPSMEVKPSSQVSSPPLSLLPFCILGPRPGWLQPTLLGHTHLWEQGWALPGCVSLPARLRHSFWSRHPIQPIARWSSPLGRPPIPELASTESASDQCKGGACQLRVSIFCRCACCQHTWLSLRSWRTPAGDSRT